MNLRSGILLKYYLLIEVITSLVKTAEVAAKKQSEYTVITRVLNIPGGAGFVALTVSLDKLNWCIIHVWKYTYIYKYE